MNGNERANQQAIQTSPSLQQDTRIQTEPPLPEPEQLKERAAVSRQYLDWRQMLAAMILIVSVSCVGHFLSACLNVSPGPIPGWFYLDGHRASQATVDQYIFGMTVRGVIVGLFGALTVITLTQIHIWWDA